eukprot:1211950-Alexandrium_andersonii.AAC.1
MDVARWATCEFARSLDLNMDDWDGNAKMAEKANELFDQDNDHPVFYARARVKHNSRKVLHARGHGGKRPRRRHGLAPGEQGKVQPAPACGTRCRGAGGQGAAPHPGAREEHRPGGRCGPPAQRRSCGAG